MRYRNMLMAFCAVLSLVGCASSSLEKPVRAPEDELAFAGGSPRNGASASMLGVKAMTQEELKTCATTLVDVKNRSDRASAESRAIKADEARLMSEEKQIESDREKIDRTSKNQVESFNNRLRANQDAIRSFNSHVGNYNGRIRAIEQTNNWFNLNCANRPYRVVDLNVLSEEQKRAMKAGATEFDLPVYSEEATPPSKDPP